MAKAKVEEVASEFLDHALKGMQECDDMTEDQKEECFSQFVSRYNSGGMHLEALAAMSVIIFGFSEGVKRFRGAVPLETRKAAALRAQKMQENDDHVKKNVIKVYLGEDAEKILAA
jgi:hypothetical protein